MTGMTDGILAGYDGSPGSAEALRWAAREAWARGTALTLCLARPPDELGLLGDGLTEKRSRKVGEEILARGVRLAASMQDLHEVRSALTDGPAAEVLCERSARADMVVLGSRGHGGLADSSLGSVPWHVACQGRGPVVVVRGRWRPVQHAPGLVVAGVDGSPPSEEALTFAFEEARLHQTSVVALCALADAPGRLGGMHRMEDAFTELITAYEKKHPEVPVLRQVTFSSPRSALMAAAADAQLLVLGSRGLGGIDGMSLGSVASALLLYSPGPVAVIHP